MSATDTTVAPTDPLADPSPDPELVDGALLHKTITRVVNPNDDLATAIDAMVADANDALVARATTIPQIGWTGQRGRLANPTVTHSVTTNPARASLLVIVTLTGTLAF